MDDPSLDDFVDGAGSGSDLTESETSTNGSKSRRGDEKDTASKIGTSPKSVFPKKLTENDAMDIDSAPEKPQKATGLISPVEERHHIDLDDDESPIAPRFQENSFVSAVKDKPTGDGETAPVVKDQSAPIDQAVEVVDLDKANESTSPSNQTAKVINVIDDDVVEIKQEPNDNMPIICRDHGESVDLTLVDDEPVTASNLQKRSSPDSQARSNAVNVQTGPNPILPADTGSRTSQITYDLFNEIDGPLIGTADEPPLFVPEDEDPLLAAHIGQPADHIGIDPILVQPMGDKKSTNKQAIDFQKLLLARANKNSGFKVPPSLSTTTPLAAGATARQLPAPNNAIPEAHGDPNPDDDDPDDDPVFAEERAMYKRLKSKGLLMPQHEINYERAKQVHAERKLRKIQEQQIVIYDSGDDNSDQPEEDAAKQQVTDLANKAAALRRRKPRTLTQKQKDDAQQARDEAQKAVAEDLTRETISKRAKEKAKRDKQKNKGANGKKDTHKRKKDSDEGEPEPKPKKRKKSEHDDVATPKKKLTKKQQEMENLWANLTGDPLGDANEAQGLAVAPNFGSDAMSKTRKDALLGLVASVPEDYQKVAKKTKNDLDKAAAKLPRNFTGPEADGRWWFKHMKSKLWHHQILGVSFMFCREAKRDLTQGGMNASEMGFGKTVMTIALMLANSAKVPGQCKATLIVVPPTLVNQWSGEFVTHIESSSLGQILIQRSGSRIEGQNAETIMENCFAVITTYQEVLRSSRQAECPSELVTDEAIAEWYEKEGKKQVGILHRIKWHRIVLDEAQYIKNYSGSTAKACYQLQGDRRWVLSGTPLVNSVFETYSYMLFLKMPLTGNQDQWENNFSRDQRGMKRLQTMLQTIMFRLTHKDRLFGMRIIDIPDNFKATITIDFTRVERLIYDIVKKRMVDHINKESRKNHLRGRYRHVFLMMLRLRQLTTHCLQAWETCRNLLEPEDYEQLQTVVSETQEGADDFHIMTQLRKQLDNVEKSYNSSAKPNTDIFSKSSKFGRRDPEGPALLDELTRMKDSDVDPLCDLCQSIPEKPVKTSCGHIFCRECLENNQDDNAFEGRLKNACYTCGEVYTGVSIVPEEYLSPKETKRKQKERKENQDQSWILAGETLYPTAKLLMVKTQLCKWLSDAPKDKIIIYAQFRPVLTCLGRICDDEGWGYEMYHGGIPQNARDAVLKRFADEPEKKILICGLKAGGTGLNLVMANRVMSLDLWFNASMETQAFCRVFRIGQSKPTFVTRMVVKDTIDDLLAMQERKSRAISKAMNDDRSLNEKLTFHELLSLFGTVEYSEDGAPFIVPDYKSYAERDHFKNFSGRP